MKFKLNNKYVRWGVTAFLVVAAGILFYYFVFHSSNILAGLNSITNILMPLVFGLATAYLMTPVLNYIESKILVPICEKLGIKKNKRRNSIIRGISVFLSAFIFIALIYMLIYMLISQLVPSIQNIIDNLDNYTENITDWFNRMMDDNPQAKDFVLQTVDRYSDQLDQMISQLPSNARVWLRTVTNTATNILGMLWNFAIGFIISIYLMASKEKFVAQAKKMTYAMFERDTANTIIKTFRFTHKTFIGFISGKIADSVIIGLLCFIGVTLMQTPYPVVISVIIGVTNIIPFIGPFLGAIPSAFLILIVDPMHPLKCLYFVLFAVVLQQFDGNILGPKILGDSTGLTSFWVIFAITFFGGLFGLPGMIVGVPLFAVIYAGIKSFVNTRLAKKEMPIETGQYEKLEYVDDEGFHHYVVPEPAAKPPKKKRKASSSGAEEDKEDKSQ